mgnify:CR=1 FL=1
MAGKVDDMPIWELNALDQSGRVEITDPAIAGSFNLSLSQAAAEKIQRIEESVVSAEHRLGFLLVG